MIINHTQINCINNNSSSSKQQVPDPLNDPNVYKIQPDKVNITLAPPEHLNPQYQEYLANEPDRF